MKKKFTIFLLGNALLLCSPLFSQDKNRSIKQSASQEKKMTPSQNKEIIRKIYEECLNKRNYELLKDLVSEEYSGPRGEKGPGGFEQTVKPIIAAFPDIHWNIEDLLEEGDKVIVRWSWQGTHTQPYLDIPASNRTVKNDAIAIYQVKDSKVVMVWMQSDRLGFLIQTGVISADVIPGRARK